MHRETVTGIQRSQEKPRREIAEEEDSEKDTKADPRDGDPKAKRVREHRGRAARLQNERRYYRQLTR
jgi:hypothetical protein